MASETYQGHLRHSNECVVHAQTPFLFGSPCQQTVNNFVPTIEPLWNCGLRVTGDFTCPAGWALILSCATFLPPAILKFIYAPINPFPSLVWLGDHLAAQRFHHSIRSQIARAS
jgi:hypothetical protein